MPLSNCLWTKEIIKYFRASFYCPTSVTNKFTICREMFHCISVNQYNHIQYSFQKNDIKTKSTLLIGMYTKCFEIIEFNHLRRILLNSAVSVCNMIAIVLKCNINEVVNIILISGLENQQRQGMQCYYSGPVLEYSKW